MHSPETSSEELKALEVAAFGSELEPRCDHAAALEYYLANPVTKGTMRLPLLELEDLTEIIHRHPQAAVAISDGHADLEVLTDTLGRLDVIDDAHRRRPDRGRLFQLCDLVDGRHAEDLSTLEWGAVRCNVVATGNHEAALLGGKTFRRSEPDPPRDQRRAEHARQPLRPGRRACRARRAVHPRRRACRPFPGVEPGCGGRAD